MRIVFTVHQFLPDFSAGTEILTYETAKEFIRRGYDVSIFTGFPVSFELKDNERFDNYVFDGIQVHRFKHNFSPMGSQSEVQELGYNNLLFADYFREYLLNKQPDVVHFFHLARLSASAIDVCNELAIPTVLTPTDFWFICPTAQLRLPDNRPCLGPDQYGVNCLRHIASVNQSTKIQKWLGRIPDGLLGILLQLIKRGVVFDKIYTPRLRAFVKRAGFLKQRMNQIDSIAIPTQVMRKLLVHNGLDSQRTFLLPFGLNPVHSNTIVKKKHSDKTLRLGYIGTLAEYKGVHVLLESVRKLFNKPIQVKIYGHVGDYPDYVETLRKISDGDSRVEFCGTFPNSQIGSIFSNFDVLVVPSLWYENSPLVIYSAQAARCPVIASNMAGISEVIEHGKNGLLFEAGNVLELTNIVERLLEDRALLQRFSENAKTPLTIHEYADRLLKVYNEITQDKVSL